MTLKQPNVSFYYDEKDYVFLNDAFECTYCKHLDFRHCAYECRNTGKQFCDVGCYKLHKEEKYYSSELL